MVGLGVGVVVVVPLVFDEAVVDADAGVGALPPEVAVSTTPPAFGEDVDDGEVDGVAPVPLLLLLLLLLPLPLPLPLLLVPGECCGKYSSSSRSTSTNATPGKSE